MKKIIVLLLVINLIMLLCSCSAENNTQTTEQTETQLHTIAAPKGSDTIEWCPVSEEVSIADANLETVLDTKDIEAFSITGSNDDDSYITIKLTDTGKEVLEFMLPSSKGDTLNLIVNGEAVCSFILNEEVASGTFNIGQKLGYEELCKITTKMRGLDQ